MDSKYQFFISRPWRIFALIVEPIVLLIAAGLIARQLLSIAGVRQDAADVALLSVPPRWGDAAIATGQSHLLKWGLLLAIAWWLSRLRGYRITQPIRPVQNDPNLQTLSLPKLVLFGIAISIPLHLLAILPRWYHYHVASLGEVPAVWDIIYKSQWTPGFWAFMAIGSFALVPIVEELFFRGYYLGALATRFSPAWCIGISSVVFAGVHLQYVRGDLFALYNLVSVMLVAAVYAWSVFRVRSLVPAIAGHSYGNFPQPLHWAPFECVALLISIGVLFWLLPQSRPD